MQSLSFGNVEELLSYLRSESAKGERFATRFVLVQGCRAWVDLIPRLALEVEKVVYLSEFCSSCDVFPNMQRFLAHLKEKEEEGCRSVLILPLAECIRLDQRYAEILRLLGEWPAERIRRIYVPLLAAKDFFFKEMNGVMRYRAGELPEPWELEGDGDAEVIVAPFSAGFADRQVARGIKEYLSLWEQGAVKRVWLVTGMAPWLPIREVWSECRVRLYPSSFNYLQRNLGCDGFCEKWGSEELWEWLATQLQEGESFDQLAGRLLNIADYDAEQLFALWSGFDQKRRWLVWLWSKKRAVPGTYLYHVMKTSNSVEELSRDAAMTIFDLPHSVSFSRERKELLRRLGVKFMPPEFWERYSEIADPSERVPVLTDLSPEEREQLVLCVGKLLAEDSGGRWWEYLEVAFPALAWYLQPPSTGDQFVDQYFSVYNRCRLKDQPDEELAKLLDKWVREQLLWNYPPRSVLLAEQRSPGAKVVWVDAMGVEWAGLLASILVDYDDQLECEVKLARSSLPTTTEANSEWNDNSDEVVRRLDDIAHHYDYKFPKSFLTAIEAIEIVAHRVLSLLSQYPQVIITSDHGLSRFAATSEVKIEPPEWAEVKHHGRCAIVLDGCRRVENSESWIVDKDYLVLLEHSRFKGGSSFGEVHGGATPEESLVPLIVVSKKSAVQLQFEVVTPVIRLNPQGEGVLTVRCHQKVSLMDVRVSGRTIQGQSDTGFTWSFRLKGLSPGRYSGKLYAAGQFIGKITFEVMRGIIEEDLGL
ncbi:MAG: BREX-4 system phosphatase PglZ [Thermacetogeniaceae bacterium]